MDRHHQPCNTPKSHWSDPDVKCHSSRSSQMHIVVNNFCSFEAYNKAKTLCQAARMGLEPRWSFPLWQIANATCELAEVSRTQQGWQKEAQIPITTTRSAHLNRKVVAGGIAFLEISTRLTPDPLFIYDLIVPKHLASYI